MAKNTFFDKYIKNEKKKSSIKQSELDKVTFVTTGKAGRRRLRARNISVKQAKLAVNRAKRAKELEQKVERFAKMPDTPENRAKLKHAARSLYLKLLTL